MNIPIEVPEFVNIPLKHLPGFLHLPTAWDPKNQVFSHCDTAGIWRHFHIATLLGLIEQSPSSYQLVEVDITSQDAAHVAKNFGIEVAHFDRMDVKRLAEPGLICRCSDEKDIVIDGNHRFVRRFTMGLRTMEFWLLREEQCHPAMLDFPDRIMANKAKQ